jgi:hypothetical protein
VRECRDELAAKDSAEHFDRKKERIDWLDPTRAIGRKSTGRHHTMYMRMKFELLTPSMQDNEEANFCTEMLGVAGDLEKRFGTGAKQEIVDDLLVLQSQRGQLARQREDHMHVLRRKKFPVTLLEPIKSAFRWK